MKIKPPETLVTVPTQPINGQPSGLNLQKRRSFASKRPFKWIIIAASSVLVAAIVAGTIWYQVQLSPRSVKTNRLVEVVVASGDSTNTIGSLLQQKGVIRSDLAFQLYTSLSGTGSLLEAGTYRLNPSQSVPQIVAHLKNGNVDTFTITFLPGATLAQDRQVLLDAGYKSSDVDNALAAGYNSPLFTDKPAGTDLEGYLYGDTYQFNAGATVSTILQRVFAEMNSVVQSDQLVSNYSAHGLTLYQGITLASIIQREVSSASDQKQVAQVFYLRLADGMPLGSDVTYIYGASLLGVTATPTLDSPYNTRINTGLPPGPISSPGRSALDAVAHPANGDYLYFLSGDDGKTYFATTEAQHEANIANYCQQKCSQS